MTHIGRFEGQSGSHHTVRALLRARQQMEYTFPNDERRKIPQVKAVFDQIDAAVEAANALAGIFAGSGTHTVADFIPDETGESENDRQMRERRKSWGAW